jgi:UPF0148 protein
MVKKPDEIMAEYLLKGGKMLSRECPACRSPLFEIKGETLCVVCRDQGQGRQEKVESGIPKAEAKPSGVKTAVTSGIAGEIEATVVCLCQRAREEPDPSRCRVLMECVKLGVDTLTSLNQE